jgi:hypothetical protein
MFLRDAHSVIALVRGTLYPHVTADKKTHAVENPFGAD